MSIRRTHLTFDNYAQIPNAWMRDTRLSRKARGLLAELLTHRVGWEITIESLVDGGPEGRDAIRTALRELERHGYLARRRLRREDGTLSGSDYELREPVTGEPTAENPTEAERPLKKTIIQEDHLSEDHDLKSPASGRRRMSDAQLRLLVDLILMQDLERTVEDAQKHARSFVSSYDEADELIKEYWQLIEHAGRGDVAYQARTSGVYVLLSDRGRAFVDSEWSQPGAA